MVHRIRIRRQGPHNRDCWCCQLRMALRHRNHRIGDRAQQRKGVRLPLFTAPLEKRHDGLLLLLLLCALGTTHASAKAGGPDMFYSVDRSGLYQTGGTLDLWQQDPVLGRPFWRLPDSFEAGDLRAHVAELFPDGLSLHGWQYMVERHDFIRPTNSDALFVNHNMVVELVFEYVRRAVFPSRRSRFQSFFAWESLEMARAFRKEGQALYRVGSSSIFRADQSWLTLGVQNAIASLSAHRYWSGAPSGTPRWEILLAPPVRVMERID